MGSAKAAMGSSLLLTFLWDCSAEGTEGTIALRICGFCPRVRTPGAQGIFSVLRTEASPALTYLSEDGGGSVCRLHCEVIVGFLLCIKGFGNNDRAGALVDIEVTVVVAT